MFLRFAYLEVLYILVPIFLLAVAYRFKWYRSPLYTYPLGLVFLKKHQATVTYHKQIYFILRSLTLIGLLLLVARPQWIDQTSQVNIKGVDIVISLDVSGSMQIFDDIKDKRRRIDVAKKEAIRFIDKRKNDPIGLVIFANQALSRSPLTLDKKFLKDIIGGTRLGMLDPNGTHLGTGLALAVNRLKNSEAKSKIVILLTDGEPTPGEKIEPQMAIDLAKEFGVKVYTIGVGSDRGGYVQHQFGGFMNVAQTAINVTLLKKIAKETGGKFFRASNARDMRNVYDTIDLLEKTEHKTNVFHRYYEAFLSFIWIILLLLGIELVLRFFIWRGV